MSSLKCIAPAFVQASQSTCGLIIAGKSYRQTHCFEAGYKVPVTPWKIWIKETIQFAYFYGGVIPFKNV
jgi:hypothetical protein